MTEVLLLDVMGTLVHEPFVDEIPAFFGMSLRVGFPPKSGQWNYAATAWMAEAISNSTGLMHAANARRGLFVRVPSLMDRADEVRRVVFDETGTLTVGNPTLRDTAPIDALTPPERAVLYDLAARSTHPKSRAITDVLVDGVVRPELVAHEEPSCGMQALFEGTLFRLGRPSWAAPEHALEGADPARRRARAATAPWPRASTRRWPAPGECPAPEPGTRPCLRRRR